MIRCARSFMYGIIICKPGFDLCLSKILISISDAIILITRVTTAFISPILYKLYKDKNIDNYIKCGVSGLHALQIIGQ